MVERGPPEQPILDVLSNCNQESRHDSTEVPVSPSTLAQVHHVHAVLVAAASLQGYIEALEVEVAIYRMCMPLPPIVMHEFAAWRARIVADLKAPVRVIKLTCHMQITLSTREFLAGVTRLLGQKCWWVPLTCPSDP